MLRSKLPHLLIIGLVATACSKRSDYPTLLSHLEKKASSDDKALIRQIATQDADVCLKDVFSVSTLKAEIKEWEKKFSSGKKVTGKWKHLNLADLPIPQANFLKSYGDRIGDRSNPNAFDYSSCQDVPCIFNKIYGKEDYVAGYVHYLYYLKMGHLLGASNFVYESSSKTPGVYNGKSFKVSDYLYREKELFGWWRLLKMIKTPYTALKDLQEIYRVPQGEHFDFEESKLRKIREENERLKAEGKPTKSLPSSFTCGLAYSSGHVILQDLCLSLDEQSWRYGNFYDSVLHELAHQVDYHEGRKLGKTYRSKEKDYLELSGFYLTEYVDEQNRTVRQWNLRETAKLPSSYGGTSPAENYAESLALFRTQGSSMQRKLSAEHWDFTSKTYYSGKDFGEEALVRQWVDSGASQISQLAFRAVSECSNRAEGFASTYFKKTDFSIPVQAAMLNCLGAKATDISREIRAKVNETDPDGCTVLHNHNVKTYWEPAIKPSITDMMTKYLKELAADKTYFAKIQAFIDDIPSRDVANSAYLACAEPQDEEACYYQGMINLSLEKLAPLNLPQVQALELAEMYAAAHPLSETKQYLISYYRSFVQSNREQILGFASEMWEVCASGPVNEDASPVGKYFTLSGDDYMVSSVYNCLNSSFPDTAKLIVRGLAVDEIRVQHPKEEKLLYEEVVPELKAGLSALYQKKKEVESKQVSSYIAEDEGALRKLILSDFNWVKDVLDMNKLTKDCELFALKKIDFPVKYQVKREAFSSLITNACTDVHQTSQYNSWLESSQSVFAEKSVEGLENRILELARAKADQCLVQYPTDTNLNRIKYKKEREACLVGEWSSLEGKALKEFEADPIVIKFRVDVEAVKRQLETNRRRLQLKVIKEKF